MKKIILHSRWLLPVLLLSGRQERLQILPVRQKSDYTLNQSGLRYKVKLPSVGVLMPVNAG